MLQKSKINSVLAKSMANANPTWIKRGSLSLNVLVDSLAVFLEPWIIMPNITLMRFDPFGPWMLCTFQYIILRLVDMNHPSQPWLTSRVLRQAPLSSWWGLVFIRLFRWDAAISPTHLYRSPNANVLRYNFQVSHSSVAIQDLFHALPWSYIIVKLST